MHYFQAHPIAVYTEFMIKNILSKADLSRRLSKWGIELGQSDIKLLPRAAIKRQVLTDFVAEFLTKKLVETKSTLKGHEVIKERPQGAKVTIAGEITRVPRLI